MDRGDQRARARDRGLLAAAATTRRCRLAVLPARVSRLEVVPGALERVCVQFVQCAFGVDGVKSAIRCSMQGGRWQQQRLTHSQRQQQAVWRGGWLTIASLIRSAAEPCTTLLTTRRSAAA